MDKYKMQNIFSEAQIEEMGGRRKFSLSLNEPVKEYEKRMLCDTDCPYVLPMNFLAEDDVEKVFYDITGFLPLAEYVRQTTAETRSVRDSQKLVCGSLGLLKGLMECIKGLESYLIDPKRITIHPEVIFIHSDTGYVRLAFYPNDTKEAFLPEEILPMMEDLYEQYENAEVNQYFSKFKDFIRKKNPGLDSMIAVLGSLQREVGYIYWNPEDFRGEEKEKDGEYESFPGTPENRHGIMGKIRKDKGMTGRSQMPTKGLNGRSGMPAPVKPIVIQIALAAILTVIYFSGEVELINFAGLAVIAAGVDLWVMRKLHYV